MGPQAVAIADGAAATLADRRQDILAGLTAANKRLSPTYLYDERGSQLFDEICTLPEYYATRTELTLLRANAAELAVLVGPRAEIVELGAGSSLKARLLLGSLEQPASYQPVDISAEYLAQQAAEIAAAYPNVAFIRLGVSLGRPRFRRRARNERSCSSGSTIGNLSRSQRRPARLARRAHRRRTSARRGPLSRPSRAARGVQR
jgi:uncharacterized SAM-dependent methyltransferase